MTRRAQGGVLGIAFDGDGKVLATTSDDGSVSVWDVPSGTLRETFLGHSAAAVGPVFSRDGTTLYSGSGDGSVIAWDVRGLRRLGRPFRFAPTPAVGEGPNAELQDAAKAVAPSPDGSLFATSPGSGRVTLWRTRDESIERELAGSVGAIESLVFDHDGRLLAATGNGPRTVVWDVRTGKAVLRLKRGGPLGSAAVAFSTDDRLVATAGIDGRVRVYRVSTGKQVGGFSVRGSLQDLDFSPDGSRLAAAGLAGEIALWDLKTRRVERRIEHGVAILALRFSPDGRTLASGDLAGAVDFWNATTGRPAGRPLAGQNGLVLSVSYSPDGSKLVTASSDGRLRLYDLETGKLIGAPLPGAGAGGWAAFLPDGKHVVAAVLRRDGRRLEPRPGGVGRPGMPRREQEPDAGGVARLPSRARLRSRVRLTVSGHRLYSSWRRNQFRGSSAARDSFRPCGVRSSHWYMPQRPSRPRA